MYKLVIAEDDEILLRGLSTMFDWDELDVCVVAAVDDGDKALQEVIKTKADILLTDIRMTNMDGLELVEQIRKIGLKIDIVIMSAYDDFAFAQRALRLEVGDYILKPIELSLLRETIRHILVRKHERKQQESMLLWEQDTIELDEKEVEYRLVNDDAYVNKHNLETYFNDRSIINKIQIADVAKLILLGNVQEIEKQLSKVLINLRKAGSDSMIMFTFFLSYLLGKLGETLQGEYLFDEGYAKLYADIMHERTLRDAMKLLRKKLLDATHKIALNNGVNLVNMVKQACAYIDSHYKDASLRVNDVAYAVGLSPNYFSSVFAEITGVNFTDYLIDKRMREAQLLIVYSDYTSQEIGYMVGYSNPSYFSAAFKKYTGMTVSKYKEMIGPYE